MFEQPVTMKTVAERAKVSQMTVSMALRNHPRISLATRQRIKEIADELGYRPNPLVSSLMAQFKSKRRVKVACATTLAYLISHPDIHACRENPVLAGYYQGVKERTERLGFQCEEFYLKQPGMTSARMNQIFKTRGIQGVIVAPIPRSGGHLSLNWSSLAVSTIGFALARPNIHRASSHHYLVMLEMMRNLRRLGYRRIGLQLLWGADKRVHYAWTGAYLSYYFNFFRTEPLSIFVTTHMEREDKKLFFKWFRKNRPDVVVSIYPQTLQWLQEEGLRVPEDVGWAKMEWIPQKPEWSGIDLNYHKIGAAAVDLVVEQLHNNERGIPAIPKNIFIEGKWMLGQTVRKMESTFIAPS